MPATPGAVVCGRLSGYSFIGVGTAGARRFRMDDKSCKVAPVEDTLEVSSEVIAFRKTSIPKIPMSGWFAPRCKILVTNGFSAGSMMLLGHDFPTFDTSDLETRRPGRFGDSLMSPGTSTGDARFSDRRPPFPRG